MIAMLGKQRSGRDASRSHEGSWEHPGVGGMLDNEGRIHLNKAVGTLHLAFRSRDNDYVNLYLKTRDGYKVSTVPLAEVFRKGADELANAGEHLFSGATVEQKEAATAQLDRGIHWALRLAEMVHARTLPSPPSWPEPFSAALGLSPRSLHFDRSIHNELSQFLRL